MCTWGRKICKKDKPNQVSTILLNCCSTFMGMPSTLPPGTPASLKR